MLLDRRAGGDQDVDVRREQRDELRLRRRQLRRRRRRRSCRLATWPITPCAESTGMAIARWRPVMLVRDRGRRLGREIVLRQLLAGEDVRGGDAIVERGRDR